MDWPVAIDKLLIKRIKNQSRVTRISESPYCFVVVLDCRWWCVSLLLTDSGLSELSFSACYNIFLRRAGVAASAPGWPVPHWSQQESAGIAPAGNHLIEIRYEAASIPQLNTAHWLMSKYCKNLSQEENTNRSNIFSHC